MLPDSLHRDMETSAEQTVDAPRTADAIVMEGDRPSYMLPFTHQDTLQCEERTVEMCLAEGAEDDGKEKLVAHTFGLNEGTISAARPDSMGSAQERSLPGPSIQTGSDHHGETSTRKDMDDGPFLLKRSTHYISRLPVRTMSSFETAQLRRDIALARMAKSSSPPAEPSPPQILPGLSLMTPFKSDLPAPIEDLQSAPLEVSGSMEHPGSAAEDCPDDIPGTNPRAMTPSQGLIDVSSQPTAADVAAVIQVAHPIANSPCSVLSGRLADISTIAPMNQQPVAEELAIPLRPAPSDDPINVPDPSSHQASAQLTAVNVNDTSVVASGGTVSAALSDVSPHHSIPSTADDTQTTIPLAADTTADTACMATLAEETFTALVCLAPALGTLSVEGPRDAEEAVATDSSLVYGTALLTGDHSTLPIDTDEPASANTHADDSSLTTLPSSPDTLPPPLATLLSSPTTLPSTVVSISLPEPTTETTTVLSGDVGGTDRSNKLASESPSSQSRVDLPENAGQQLDSAELLDDAGRTVVTDTCSHSIPAICQSPALPDTCPSAQEDPADPLNLTDVPVLLLADTMDAETSPDGVLPLTLPAPVPSGDASRCPLVFEVSAKSQSRECSPSQEDTMKMVTNMEATDPITDDHYARASSHCVAEDTTMEDDAVNSDILDMAETTDAVDVPELADAEFDLPPSSPPPSSSPPHIFSSSPPREMYGSPPSSSPPLPELDELYSKKRHYRPAEGTQSKILASTETLKRSATALDDAEVASEDDERTAKRVKIGPSSALADPPLPKRLTQASVAKQHKKLAAPFRSPVVKGPLVAGGLHAVYATGRALMPPPLRKAAADAVPAVSPREMLDVKPDPTAANKDRTANAAKQFKSPLVASGAAASSSAPASGSLFSTVKAAPTIQALQGKLQTLKQAIRIKSSERGDEEDELERLVAKWTAAGREVAWAVWDYVKDLAPESGPAPGGDFWDAKPGQKRGFEPGWGYDDEHAPKKARLDEGMEEREGVEEEDFEAPPAVQHTLGTMLRHMNIDPATLGWDEEEGDFVDV